MDEALEGLGLESQGVEVSKIGGFDLSKTHVHLGPQGRAVPIPNFEWSTEFLEYYASEFALDGKEGRLVMIGSSATSWSFWERHPAGSELVVVISGRTTLIQEYRQHEQHITLGPGEAAINPPGIWHTSDVIDSGEVLFITPGIGTEHRPR
jgi:quercetin dioxygenase-like cupin family protein